MDEDVFNTKLTEIIDKKRAELLLLKEKGRKKNGKLEAETNAEPEIETGK